jgi:hypothetical protein
MRGRRGLIVSLLTVIAVLCVSIFVGLGIGDRIRALATSQSAGPNALPTPVPDDAASLSPAQSGWKHIQVIAIATDPGFPDPRVTPTPLPPTPSPNPNPTQSANAAPRSMPSKSPGSSGQRPVWEIGTPSPHGSSNSNGNSATPDDLGN